MEILTTKEFEERIQMGIPYSKAPMPMNWSPYTNVPFDCGCGKTHAYNNLHTPPFWDLGMYKGCIMVNECKFLNTVKVRGFTQWNKFKTLYSCKFEIDKPRFGFVDDSLRVDKEIQIWIDERWNL